jgi:hypothetical protein
MVRPRSKCPMSARIALCVGALVLTAAMPQLAKAQAASDDNAAAMTVQKASKQGYPLSSSTNVSGNVSVEAVLLPPKISKRVFGKTVGENYAVIELTISNRSSDASLIVHSVLIDYSGWLLSGYSSRVDGPCTSVTGQSSSMDAKPERASLQSSPGCGNTPGPWQSASTASQVASVETRVVRGELLDEQPWTTRNWVIRALQAAGSIASAYSFTLSGQHAIQSISAFNGQVVPAAQTFWPDATIGQMNRISDLGFQVNKVIPKESSDVIVAFFPIERFLTPGLRKLFMDSPAVFFSPNAIAVDSTVQKQLKHILGSLFDNVEVKDADFGKSLVQIAAGACGDPTNNKWMLTGLKESAEEATKRLTNACQLETLLNRFSLNTVRMVVGGTMTVDVDSIPATISSVETTPPSAALASQWTNGLTASGIIRGSFLSGGTPALVGAPAGVTIANVKEGSTDNELHFTLTVAKGSTAPDKLTFKVTKSGKQNGTIESSTYDYKIMPAPAAT